MNLEIKQKWLEALRSGRYAQGQGILRNTNNEYCCLGVLCDLVAPLDWVPDIGIYRMKGHSGLLPAGIGIAAGLSVRGANKLIDLNDKDKKSFVEIANYIEANL